MIDTDKFAHCVWLHFTKVKIFLREIVWNWNGNKIFQYDGNLMFKQ